MTKKLTKGILTALVFAVAVLTLCSCGLYAQVVGVPVTKIVIESTNIYLAPLGEASTYRLQPSVEPANATVKSVSYRILDKEDRRYLEVSAIGELTAHAEKEGDEPIVVRIFSDQNSSIYLDVNVYIGSATLEVSKITLEPSEVSLELGEETVVRPKAVFTPVNAVIGRNLTWSSLNEDVVRVDQSGNLTPISPGITYVFATSTVMKDGAPVRGNLKVTVTYPPLSYEIRSVSENNDALRQIVGEEEEIHLNLLQMDERCDPDPLIRWYVNDQRISASEGKREFIYTPVGQPRGTYTIRAEISNNVQTLKLEYPVKLVMYLALTDFSVDVVNGFYWHVGDVITVQASYGEDYYPPEQFEWYVRAPGESGRGNFIATTSTNRLAYELQREGRFVFTAVPVIKGLPRYDLEHSSETVTADAMEEGCEIYDLYFDATIDEGNVRPVIKWRYPGYEANYRIQIITESDDVYDIETDRVIKGTVPMAVLSEVSLEDNFSVRVATERYGWSDPIYYYPGKISPTDEAYFADLETSSDNGYSLRMNGYIANMEEMGDLLNYVSLYRPEKFRDSDSTSTSTYVITYKTAFSASSLDPDLYPYDDKKENDAMKIVRAAFNAYCESGGFTPAITENPDGGVSLYMTFADAPAEGILESEHIYHDLKTLQHYSSRPNADDALTIEKETPSALEVSTSNQLVFAVQNGLYPRLKENSNAERVWEEAKAVSLRIIHAEMSERDKVHAIYDFLTTEVVYDYAMLEKVKANDDDESGANKQLSTSKSFFLEGVFDDGIAVCDGIAKAFVLLARMNGIAAEKITGKVPSGNTTVGHAWNKLKVDGEWYGADATWGNVNRGGSQEVQTHLYLFVDDAFLSVNHNGYGEYPAAGAMSSAYYNAKTEGEYDAVVESLEEFAASAKAVFSALAIRGETVFWEFKIASTLSEADIQGYWATLAGQLGYFAGNENGSVARPMLGKATINGITLYYAFAARE